MGRAFLTFYQIGDEVKPFSTNEVKPLSENGSESDVVSN